MAFQNDLIFPRDVAGGLMGGPERRVDIVPLGNGAEQRNARWADSRRSFNAGLGIRRADQLAAVVALFEEAGGPLTAFRFRDWSDFKSGLPSAEIGMDQLIGTGDGAETGFQLVKVYGAALPYTRPITKPVPGSVRIWINGSEQSTGWTVDTITGRVTFAAAPPLGTTIRAGFEFDIPVRFAAQSLEIDMAYFTEDPALVDFGSVPQIPLIEVRE